MLARALHAFGARGVNLMALQSRPERSAPWTYRFYVDLDGAASDPRIAEAIEEVESAGDEAGSAGKLRGVDRRQDRVSPPVRLYGFRERSFPAGR